MRRLGLVVALLLASGCAEEWEIREREAKERAEYEDLKRMDRHLDLEWVACVNDLGIDRCRAIQETGFRQCQNWVFGEEKGIKNCGERRLDDLKRKLAEKAKEEAEAEIAKEEAEKKANMKAEAEDPVPGETSG